MGSARAARAVFRALAENHERTEKFRRSGNMSRAQRLDARRVQRHPRRVCSPTSDFGFNPKTEVEMGSARAARAVFRALAENHERTEKFRRSGNMSRVQRLDARRVQR